MSALHTGLTGSRWRRLRRRALIRDAYTCQVCGRIGARLEVDHIEPLHRRPDLAYVLANLQAICKPCHHRKTAGENQTIERRPDDRAAWAGLVAEFNR